MKVWAYLKQQPYPKSKLLVILHPTVMILRGMAVAPKLLFMTREARVYHLELNDIEIEPV